MAEAALAPAKAAASAAMKPAATEPAASKPAETKSAAAKTAAIDSPSAMPGTAATRRAIRAQQARWLLSSAGGRSASHTTLSAIEWSDLGQLPKWVFSEHGEMTKLVAHVGALGHAAALRHCIDGRVLAAVRSRIGDAAFTALMTANDEAGTSAPGLIDSTGLDAVMAAMDDRARAVLLGSIAHGALREAVRERLWPDAPPLLRPDGADHAQALVALAHQHLAEQHRAEQGVAQ